MDFVYWFVAFSRSSCEKTKNERESDNRDNNSLLSNSHVWKQNYVNTS